MSEAYIYASVEDHAGSDKGGCLQSVLPGYFANKLVSTGGSFLCKANCFDPEGLHSMTQHITSWNPETLSSQVRSLDKHYSARRLRMFGVVLPVCW